MSKRTWALIAATMVAVIYGVTFTIAKDVMPRYIAPYGFILVRVGGSMLLFWIIAFVGPKEKIAFNDYPRIIAAAFFGVALNMLTFFKGLSYTSPIMGAVLMVTTPIIVLVLSAVLMRERMENKKTIGIVLGLLGTIILILYGKSLTNASNPLLGNLLVFINAVSYGFYLILVKKLIDKYNAFTFVKWIYLFGFLMVLPFGWQEIQQVAWQDLPVPAMINIGFVIIFSTFLTYLLNLISMRELKPTTVAIFIYLQPLFATLFAVSLGKDHISALKVVSAAFIFLGVYLVTHKKHTAKTNEEW